jgi:tRNA(Leu) C34 or U34 (ribose-2'-O)-methylase TrmL
VTGARDEDGLTIWRRGQTVGQGAGIIPTVPAIVLHSPKYPHNVGQVVRLASCYGIAQVWFSGQRVNIHATAGERLPREERMRGYADVTLIRRDDPLSVIIKARPEAIPIAVELRPTAERLPDFEHPENAVYEFGPEDGSLGGHIVKRCHRFVVIPALHCLNLATSVGTILYDRTAKAGLDLTVAAEERRLRA